MRMSIPGGIAACAILAAVPLLSVALSTPAFAVKQSAVLAACKRTAGCWTTSIGNGGVAGCSPNACFECYKGNCHRTAITATGGAKVQRGPDAFVMPAGGAKGNVSPQRAGTAVVVKPYRPTVDNPGPIRPGSGGMPTGSGKGGKPEVRDHRH
jgi:hypothetical protein